MWTEITRPKYERHGGRYGSDLTDMNTFSQCARSSAFRGTRSRSLAVDAEHYGEIEVEELLRDGADALKV